MRANLFLGAPKIDYCLFLRSVFKNRTSYVFQQNWSFGTVFESSVFNACLIAAATAGASSAKSLCNAPKSEMIIVCGYFFRNYCSRIKCDTFCSSECAFFCVSAQAFFVRRTQIHTQLCVRKCLKLLFCTRAHSYAGGFSTSVFTGTSRFELGAFCQVRTVVSASTSGVKPGPKQSQLNPVLSHEHNNVVNANALKTEISIFFIFRTIVFFILVQL